MIKRHRLAALAIIVAFHASSSRADSPLATFIYTGQGSVSPAGGVPEWQPFISYSAPTDPPFGLLDNVTMGFLDVVNGTSYDLTGDYTNAETAATSGTPHSVWMGINVPNGGTGSFLQTTEPLLIAGAVGVAPGVGPVDFAGFDLTRVRVMSTSYQGIVPGTFEVTTEFTVYGDPIPEPGTVVLTVAMLGAMIVGGRGGWARALRYGRPSRRG